MNLYSKFVNTVMFPVHEKIKKHSTIAVHKRMEETQWLSVEDMASLQLERLREFLGDIGKHVPYYQQLFLSLNFDPARLESIAGLQQLPLLDKSGIRDNTEGMRADNAVGLQRFNTGGSTGEPLIFYLGTKRVSHDVAAKRRSTRWWGVDIGDPEIVVWGSPIELNSQDRVRLVRDKLFRTKLLSAFEMSDQNLDNFVQTIQRVKPKMLFGYPSSLALIAEYAAAKGCPLDNLGIKVAFVTSERLYDYQRNRIESTFGCQVANGYGGRDAGFIAHQCPSGSMHITAEDIVVEIIDSEGNVLPPGENGEIVITHLCTTDFPFVRYRTGDVGRLSTQPCDCGRGLPVLDEIQGRSTDFVVAYDGKMIHGLALIYVLRDIPSVQSFKIIQESLGVTRVRIVPKDGFGALEEARIVDQFKQRLGRNVDIVIEYCDSISAEKSGKFRYVISKISTSVRGV